MQQEEIVIPPAALKVLCLEDWQTIDAAFETNCDPLTGQYPRDPMYDQLFTRIVNHAPAANWAGRRLITQGDTGCPCPPKPGATPPGLPASSCARHQPHSPQAQQQQPKPAETGLAHGCHTMAIDELHIQ